MSAEDSSVSVALLYEAPEFGAQLRQSLRSLGLPVVYEAPPHALDRAALERSHASVVVVNLDAQNEPDLDEVYSLLDDTRYRVVFNDSEVSSGLSGWDQARWMRHLTAKILGAADIDPPRPQGAEAVPAPVAPLRTAAPLSTVPVERPAVADPVKPEPAGAPMASVVQAFAAEPAAQSLLRDEPGLDDLDALFGDAQVAAPASIDIEPDFVGSDAPAVEPRSIAVAPPEDPGFEDFGIEFDADIAAPFEPVHDAAGDMPAPDEFGALDLDSLDLDSIDLDSIAVSDEEPAPQSAHLPAAHDIEFAFAADPAAGLPQPVPAPAASADEIAIPSEWALEILDADALSPMPGAPARAVDFGIEKLRAEEFLAPDVDAANVHAFPAAPELALELIPLEEAVAPTAMEAAGHENRLETPQAKVRRVWVLGASIGGPEAVREFLAALPHDYPALFLLAQHLGDEFVDMLAKQLAQATALTVRTPTHGERVSHGEVIIMPVTQRLRVDPLGVVVVERDTEESAYRPSIDRVLRDAADRFGANVGAIVFSGMSDDAVEGCRYLAARGGVIYAQHPDTCVVSTMIDGVCEAGLVKFLGSPQELAEKLLANPA
ncbi:MAG: chemotaxis protein CheB [Lysobacterales bacterium]